ETWDRSPCASATSAYELQQKDLGRLHRMAARGDLAWLRRWRWWLKRVDIDRQDKEKRTPLHLACANGHADVVRFLVQENCRLNLVDNFKRSPLMTAVQCQQEECVAILLEHGADPNLADADGNTALHLAVLSANTAVTGLLLEHHANADAQNQEGYTPLHLAVSKHQEKMEGLLQKKGADGHAQEQRESHTEGVPCVTSCYGGVPKRLHIDRKLEQTLICTFNTLTTQKGSLTGAPFYSLVRSEL
uniref:Uncharacterized protein n=1 Tax=Strix occidentalis caurina TaxID=311401 RepID=A0A8D0KSA2_STROC